ncbi:hypothetical protein [Streptomyces laurentii]|uniref:hypothetical protein n=1 Tax=Streptomyces laurentii TaxID=39478 RepID=UPI0036994D6A
MRIRPNHRTLLAAAATAALALSLTACGGGDKAAAAGGSADKPAAAAPGSASAEAATPASNEKPADTTTTGAPGTSKAPQKSSGGSSASGGSGSTTTSGSGSGVSGGSAKNNTEAYAWKHACAMSQLSVNVRPGSGSQRVIEVSNKGTSACGLDLLPAIDLGDANSADQSRNVRPLIPSGLGGPDHALLAGKKAYAVIDLNPGGKPGVKGINEMNVLVSPSHMANADTRNFPIAAGTQVSGPKLGLYRDSVADAVSSMKQADTPQQ